jgi:hypothetical protein
MNNREKLDGEKEDNMGEAMDCNRLLLPAYTNSADTRNHDTLVGFWYQSASTGNKYQKLTSLSSALVITDSACLSIYTGS